MRIIIQFSLLLIFLFLVACSNTKSQSGISDHYVIDVNPQSEISSTAGNLISTAIKETHGLDVVFYPRALLNPNKIAQFKSSLSSTEKEDLMDFYPNLTADQFRVGVMSGKAIKEFIRWRSEETYSIDLEVAGVEYHTHFIGGVLQYHYVNLENDVPIEDRKKYRVAISNFFFFLGPAFPGYRYRQGLNFSFKEVGEWISAKQSLKDYLSTKRKLRDWNEIRAKVTNHVRGEKGFQKISQIQGYAHRSPMYGYTVRTEGVVTAVGISDFYPGGIELYIQDPQPDSKIETSEAIHVHIKDENIHLQMGDRILVSGTVYEQMTTTGLSRTSLRDVTNMEVISSNNLLPKAIHLGRRGFQVPSNVISSYRGDLNLKPDLNVKQDAIDAWESIEGMRVSLSNPRVVGFNGGLTDFQDLEPKGHLNIFVLPDGCENLEDSTPVGGVLLNEPMNDHNPNIVPIVTGFLTRGLSTESLFAVGDVIEGQIEGILSYEKDFFGGGVYSLLLPEPQKALTNRPNPGGKASCSPFKDSRKEQLVTTLEATDDQLTVANYNVKNLSGNQTDRLRSLAQSIQKNLKCPDILTLVEIQDADGIEFDREPTAQDTLKKLVQLIPCGDASYEYANIDPVENDEGGQPGGNIRVAILFNLNRVSYNHRPVPGPLAETVVSQDGHINYNPGRIYPNDEAFDHTRKSIIVELEFRGETVFVIGNHLNSKLGDTSMWDAIQPAKIMSETDRTHMASRLYSFVEYLSSKAPKAHIIVAGDFNAYSTETSMKVMEGRLLKNLMLYDNLVLESDRYTTNFNGNSQPLDYILVNKSLLKKNPELEILHLNSNLMERLSDHDPLVSRFQF